MSAAAMTGPHFRELRLPEPGLYGLPAHAADQRPIADEVWERGTLGFRPVRMSERFKATNVDSLGPPRAATHPMKMIHKSAIGSGRGPDRLSLRRNRADADRAVGTAEHSAGQVKVRLYASVDGGLIDGLLAVYQGPPLAERSRQRPHALFGLRRFVATVRGATTRMRE